jgi:hypothetical protein
MTETLIPSLNALRKLPAGSSGLAILGTQQECCPLLSRDRWQLDWHHQTGGLERRFEEKRRQTQG